MHKKEVDREPASFELEAAMDKYDNPGDHLPQALDEKAYKAFTIDRILDEVLKKAYSIIFFFFWPTKPSPSTEFWTKC